MKNLNFKMLRNVLVLFCLMLFSVEQAYSTKYCESVGFHGGLFKYTPSFLPDSKSYDLSNNPDAVVIFTLNQMEFFASGRWGSGEDSKVEKVHLYMKAEFSLDGMTDWKEIALSAMEGQDEYVIGNGNNFCEHLSLSGRRYKIKVKDILSILGKEDLCGGNIYFRLKYRSHIEMENYMDKNVPEDGSFLSSSISSFFVHKCVGNEIMADTMLTPNIGSVEAPLYAIYNDPDYWAGYPQCLRILNVSDPCMYREGEHSLILNSSCFYSNYPSCKLPTDNKTLTAPYSKLNNKVDGGQFTLNRRSLFKPSNTGELQSVSCYSNTLRFAYVPAVGVDFLRKSTDETVRFFCQGDDWLEIEGREYVLRTDVVGENINKKHYDEQFYGIQYEWQYRRESDAQWKDFSATDTMVGLKNERLVEFAGKNLKISKSFLTERTYFRQKIKMAKFPLAPVYADVSCADLRLWGPANSYIAYEPYAAIQKDNFRITEDEMICKDAFFNEQEEEGKVQVEFHPSSNAVYRFCEETSSDSAFQYLWVLSKEGLKDTLEHYTHSLQCRERMEEDLIYSVKITDGCRNSVVLSSKKLVSPLPVLDRSEIEISGGALYDDGEKLTIEVVEGSPLFLSIKDENRENYDYILYYPEADGDGWVAKHLHSTRNTLLDAEKISKSSVLGTPYIVKIDRTELACESSPLMVNFNLRGEIYNFIQLNDASRQMVENGLRVVYLCQGSMSPAIDGTEFTGGFSQGSKTYIWESVSDTTNGIWSQIKSTDLNMQSLPEGALKVENEIFVRRRVVSSTENAKVESVSLPICFRPHALPNLTVKAKLREEGEERFSTHPSTWNLCYASLINVSNDNDNATFQEKGRGDLDFVKYYLTDEKGVAFDTLEKSSVGEITKKCYLVAEGSFCGKPILSINKISIAVGENLGEKGKFFKRNGCLMEGALQRVEASDDLSAAYLTTITFPNGKEEEGRQASYVIPDDFLSRGEDFSYRVKIKLDECEGEQTFIIPKDSIREKLRTSSLVVDGENVVRGDDGVYEVCKNEPFVIKDTRLKSYERVVYRWTFVNHANLHTDLEETRELSYSIPTGGKLNYFVRTTRYLDECGEISDTIFVRTRPELKFSQGAEASADVICYGEDVTLSFDEQNISGGCGSDYLYEWRRVANAEGSNNQEVLGNGKSITLSNLQEDTNVSLYITDGYCESYCDFVNQVEVKVLPDLKIQAEDLTLSPISFSPDVYETPTYLQIVNLSDSAAYQKNPKTKVTFLLQGDTLLTKTATRSTDCQFQIPQSMALESSGGIEYCLFRSLEMGSKTCHSQPYCGIIKVERGFEGNFEIKADNEYYDSVRVCPSHEILLDFDNLPNYDGEPLSVLQKNISFVWKRRRSDAVTWSVLNDQTSTSLKVFPSNSDFYYACELTYENNSGVSVSILSNPILVLGYRKQSPGIVLGAENYALCRGDEKMIEAEYLGDAGASGRYIWQISTDGRQWVDLVEDANVTGTQTDRLSYWGKFEQNTLFRCVAIDMCGDSVLSTNLLRVNVNRGDEISPSDIKCFDDCVIPDGGSLSSLTFGAPLDGDNTYFWYYNSADVVVGTRKNLITFNRSENHIPAESVGEVESFYEAGTHTINIFKKSDEGCLSDTVQYQFTLYDELKVYSQLMEDGWKCPNDLKKGSQITATIKGGNPLSEYETEWFYKKENMSSFMPLNENCGFKYEVKKLSDIQLLEVKGLEETTSFYLQVKNQGYPKSCVNSPVVTVSVFSKLDAGAIEFGETELCYDGLPFVKNVASASGGFQNSGADYVYTWLKSEDGPHGPWQEVDGVSGLSYTPQNREYRLTHNTYFRRVVADGCGTKDTTVSYRSFVVGDELLLEEDEVFGTEVVDNGSTAVLMGRDDAFRYVIFDETGYVALDTVWGGVDDRFVSDVLKNDATFFVRKMSSLGCVSKKDTMINITVRKVLKGGEIAWDDHSGEAWVCSGKSAGSISDIEEPSGENLTFLWEYSNSEDGLFVPIRGTNGEEVTSQSINLDSCAINFNNQEGREKTIFIQRVVNSSYFSYDLNRVVTKSATSNKLKVNLVPTLESISDKVIAELSGRLKVDKKVYCYGEIGEPIHLIVPQTVEEAWLGDSLGAVLYGNTLTWEWQTANGLYANKNAAKSAEWHSIRKGNFDLDTYQKVYQKDEVEDSTTIRFVIDDGCSFVATEPIPQVFSSLGKISDSLFVITPNGVEEGDNVKIIYNTKDYFDEVYWFSDAAGKDTLAKKSVVTLSDVTLNTSLYFQIGDGTCKSELVEVPLLVHKKSDGGKISGSQQICKGSLFDGIENALRASGSSGFFEYAWQYTNSPTSDKSWRTISGQTGSSLSAEIVNESILEGDTYFRRVAKNEWGREVYSDTILKSHYAELQKGDLTFENKEEKRFFCQTDTLPNIITTLPKGGLSEALNYTYSLGWEFSFDGVVYDTIHAVSNFVGTEFKTMEELQKLSYDPSVDNTFYVRARYRDEACGEICSDPFFFTLYKTAEKPVIHQEKEQCGSDTVTVSVENREDYTYRWFVIDEGKQTWEETGIYTKNLFRSNEFSVTQYGIQASSVTSGCMSDLLYFNLDSLPKLSQRKMDSVVYVCYDAALQMNVPAAEGGVGNRVYQWQYSYDNENWKDDPDNQKEHYERDYVRASHYLRRVVTDLCEQNFGEVIEVRVLDSSFAVPDLELEDFLCENQSFRVKANFNEPIIRSDEDAKITMMWVWHDPSEYLQKENDFIVDPEYYQTYVEASNLPVLTRSEWNVVHGFVGDSKEYWLVPSQEIILPSNDKMYCLNNREVRKVVAHNAVEIISELNEITCEDVRPCNGETVCIEGKYPAVDADMKDHFKYQWFSSKNGSDWEAILLADSQSLCLPIEDTLFVKRVVSNGCDMASSNLLTFVGRKTEFVDYPALLGLKVETQQLSSANSKVSVFVGEKVNDKEWFFEGDGQMPNFKQGRIELPYGAEVYVDSSLVLKKAEEGCFSSFRITPLAGGRLYIDGDGLVCGGDALPTIYATEDFGGVGVNTYQWQYKNDYVTEFVNIEGATEKYYTPKPVNVKTWYRRVVSSGCYLSYSNEVAVEIVGKPVLKEIQTVEPSSYFEKYHFEFTGGSVQRTENLPVSLKVFLHDAKFAVWEKRVGQGAWQKIGDEVKVQADSLVLKLEDNSGVVDYRVIARNDCKADTTSIFTVHTLNVPVILDDDVTIYSSSCPDGWVWVSIKPKEGYLHVAEYDASKFRSSLEGNHRVGTDGVLMEDDDATIHFSGDTLRSCLLFKDILDTFDLKITRIAQTTGAKVEKNFRIGGKRKHPDLKIELGGVEYFASETDNIDVEQGARVQFSVIYPESELSTSYWKLLDAPNPDLGGTKGLTSWQHSPICYFYNAGRYEIVATVSDVRGCEDTLVTDAIHLPISSVRKFHLGGSAAFQEEGGFKDNPDHVEVAPLLFSEYLNFVSLEQKRGIWIYDETGVVVYEGEVWGESTLSTRQFSKGVYLVKIGDWLFKTIKQ